MKITFAGLAAMTTLIISPLSQAASGLDSNAEKASYAFGYQYGQRVKGSLRGMDRQALASGIRDALLGSEPPLTTEQMSAAIMAHEQDRADVKARALARNTAAGEAFLERNAGRDGVTTTASGLQYEVLKVGKGPKPGQDAVVAVHYRGSKIDGSEFDSSHRRQEPFATALKDVIPGFREALSLMPQGSHWKVYIPAELAYGEKGAGATIGPNETLIFELELLAIRGEE